MASKTKGKGKAGYLLIGWVEAITRAIKGEPVQRWVAVDGGEEGEGYWQSFGILSDNCHIQVGWLTAKFRRLSSTKEDDVYPGDPIVRTGVLDIHEGIMFVDRGGLALDFYSGRGRRVRITMEVLRDQKKVRG